MRLKALLSMAVLGFAASAFAQAPQVVENKTESVTVVVKETPKPPDFVFELHGFTSMTMWFQDAQYAVGTSVASGQQALNLIKTFPTDKPLVGADIRQTRLNFSVRGPAVLGGAVPKAVAEFDLFGGDGPGGYGDVSVFPRIRIAYTELNWGGKHILQFGQQNMLTIGMIPQTLSHIAFPWTFTAGTVGWRQPGLWGYHTFGDTNRFEFAWSIQRAGWANTLQADNVGLGVASGLPAFEARGKFSMGKVFDVWLSGHWQQIDRNGPGKTADEVNWTTYTTALGTLGAKLDLGMLVFTTSGWYGKNAAPLLGNVVQFNTAVTGNAAATDIFGYGAWGQLGLVLTKEFSIWYGYGVDHPLYDSVFAANLAIMRNQNMMTMIRYQTGGFAIGAEWLYTRTTMNRAVPVAGSTTVFVSNTPSELAANNVLTGSQISLTANYYF